MLLHIQNKISPTGSLVKKKRSVASIFEVDLCEKALRIQHYSQFNRSQSFDNWYRTGEERLHTRIINTNTQSKDNGIKTDIKSKQKNNIPRLDHLFMIKCWNGACMVSLFNRVLSFLLTSNQKHLYIVLKWKKLPQCDLNPVSSDRPIHYQQIFVCTK